MNLEDVLLESLTLKVCLHFADITYYAYYYAGVLPICRYIYISIVDIMYFIICIVTQTWIRWSVQE